MNMNSDDQNFIEPFDATGVHPGNFEGFFEARKRPIVIKALQFHYDFKVKTNEGVMIGRRGDYLLIGVKGEKYSCAKEIFEQTYDVVNQMEKHKYG
jgi:hypothetical protein